MNNYSANPGAPEHEADPGTTRYLPPQSTGYGNSEASKQAQPQSMPVQQVGAFTHYASQAGNGYGSANQPHTGRTRDRTVLGLILIGGGVLFGLTEFSVIPGFGNLVLLLLGGIFMYAYLQTRRGYRVGFLIPGSILLGIGTGQLLSSLAFLRLWQGGDITGFTLGLGFCLIWALERKHWWSLIPGGILILSSLSRVWLIGNLWPLALIAIGAYLLLDQSRRRVR